MMLKGESCSQGDGADVTPVEVCVGLPIYNGAKTLARAIEDLEHQSYRDIMFVVSDNGSNDGTAEICLEWARRDHRVRLFHHLRTISATDNFNFVLSHCRSPYFMWAAHDDFRDTDYIVNLLMALKQHPDAILAFGDVVEYVDSVACPLKLDFATKGKNALQRMRWAAMSQLHHLYGLWRTDALQRIKWHHVDWWHDTPLMMAASQIGELIYVPGVTFHYPGNQHPFFDWSATPGGQSLDSHLRQGMRRARDVSRLIWLSGQTVADVAGTRAGIVATFWVALKVSQQIGGFVLRRLLRSLRLNSSQP